VHDTARASPSIHSGIGIDIHIVAKPPSDDARTITVDARVVAHGCL